MKARDIRFERIGDGYPEQYEAYDLSETIVGYVCVQNGRCEARCCNRLDDSEIYSKKVRGWCSFGNKSERMIHLRRIRRAIARWWNRQSHSPSLMYLYYTAPKKSTYKEEQK